MGLPESLQPASHLLWAERRDAPSGWGLQAIKGRIAEISREGASGAYTLAMRLMLEAQCQGEPVAWLSETGGFFFPPDARANGLDLDALAVVRVSEARTLARVADTLLRSGAFGLLVVDGGSHFRPSEQQLTRLAGLARRHATALLCLTNKPAAAPSLGAPVSLRGAARRVRSGDGSFSCELLILKDKRRPCGWRHAEICHAPPGLR